MHTGTDGSLRPCTDLQLINVCPGAEYILPADVARDSRREVRVEYALDVDSLGMDDSTDIRCSGIENLH